MTIKPVVVAPPPPSQKPSQKRVSNADKDSAEARNKESHAQHSHVGQVVVVEQSNSLNAANVGGRSAPSLAHSHTLAHAHRSLSNLNAVIDGHGQSPQRRSEVYDELTRHRRSPHKSSRPKRRDHHDHHHTLKRNVERCEGRDKLLPNGVAAAAGGKANKCSSPHAAGGGINSGGVGGVGSSVGGSSGGSSPTSVGSGKSSPEAHHGMAVGHSCPSPQTQNTVSQAAANLLKAVEDTYSGYNSGDEHQQPKEAAITVDEWQRRDEQFAKCMVDRGYTLKPVEEDGACLFRSISLQIYGDEDMHDVIRQHTMDYIYKNREYFCHFVTEDINSYIKRKRRKDSHGNHIEIQAISEIYSRPVEVYCYKPTPINIFNSEQLNNGYAPLRLSYQRGSHYNAIIDPYDATVGVGLGLAGYKPDLQTKEAARLSEQLELEQTMFEDKLKTTDWEATNEAIEEQIARDSYLQWCRDNLQKSRAASVAATSATVTSAEAAASDAEASPSKYSLQHRSSAANVGMGGGCGSSTITAVGLTNGNSLVGGGGGGSGGGGNGGGANMCCSNTPASSAISMLEHNFGLSPKSLMLKKDASASELGFESDDTDMSSTSSMGNCGNNSPNSAAATTTRSNKKNKLRSGGGGVVRGTTKKRRREQQQQSKNPAGLVRSNEPGNANEAPVRKSPRRESPLGALATPLANVKETRTRSRGNTPDCEQLPSTSKQSTSKLKTAQQQQRSPECRKSGQCSPPSHVSPCESASLNAATQPAESDFYHELLEASYTTDGFGQLSESEMLQRAIQMSTHDYIEDQKRKYLYGP